MPTRRRHKPLRYPDPLTSHVLAFENGQRLRRLYRRLLGREPPTLEEALTRELETQVESSATEALERELEIQVAMNSEILPKLLAQQPEFHNEPGRPEGSKDKTRRVLRPEDELTKAAIRKRRQRAQRK